MVTVAGSLIVPLTWMPATLEIAPFTGDWIVITTELAPVHPPARQVSNSVPALPSLQAVPSAPAGLLHCPVVGLQSPAVWHASVAAHTVSAPALHAPLWQVSVWVHALPSLHAVPSGEAGFEHWPVAGSQVPATWHAAGAAQLTGFAPVQAPAWQVSAWVQALPSLQLVPFAAMGLEQTPVVGLHVPAAWH
jgi:hypothetical protein